MTRTIGRRVVAASVLFATACAAPPATRNGAAVRAFVFEGAHLVAGDGAPVIHVPKDLAWPSSDGKGMDLRLFCVTVEEITRCARLAGDGVWCAKGGTGAKCLTIAAALPLARISQRPSRNHACQPAFPA